MSAAPTVITNGSLPGANGTSLFWPPLSRSCRRRSRRRRRSATASRPPGRAGRRRGSRGFVAWSEKLATRMLYCALFWRIQSQAATMSATVASPWSFITSTRDEVRRRRDAGEPGGAACGDPGDEGAVPVAVARRVRREAREVDLVEHARAEVGARFASMPESTTAIVGAVSCVADGVPVDRRADRPRPLLRRSSTAGPTSSAAPCRSARSPRRTEVFARYVIWSAGQRRVQTVDCAERPPDLRSADRVRAAAARSSRLFRRPPRRPSAGSSPAASGRPRR